jgi:hypothetical protein
VAGPSPCSGVVLAQLDEVDLAVGVYRINPYDQPEARRPGHKHGVDLDRRRATRVGKGSAPVIAVVVLGVQVAAELDRGGSRRRSFYSCWILD